MLSFFSISSQCLPVLIDVGTNTESLLQDDFYIGLRQRRDRSQKYDDLIDEFITAAKDVFGRTVLLQVSMYQYCHVLFHSIFSISLTSLRILVTQMPFVYCNDIERV